jgi:DNA-binding CsgD family transcriptional regulator
MRKAARRTRWLCSTSPSGHLSLSRAELAVARVIAEGVTSQAAAERLYLSLNTVNTHLRHVFAKLGVRSRVEMARVVLSHDLPLSDAQVHTASGRMFDDHWMRVCPVSGRTALMVCV